MRCALRQILGNFLSNAIKFTERGHVQAALEWRGEVPLAGALGGRREEVAGDLLVKFTDATLHLAAARSQVLPETSQSAAASE